MPQLFYMPKDLAQITAVFDLDHAAAGALVEHVWERDHAFIALPYRDGTKEGFAACVAKARAARDDAAQASDKDACAGVDAQPEGLLLGNPEPALKATRIAALYVDGGAAIETTVGDFLVATGFSERLAGYAAQLETLLDFYKMTVAEGADRCDFELCSPDAQITITADADGSTTGAVPQTVEVPNAITGDPTAKDDNEPKGAAVDDVSAAAVAPAANAPSVAGGASATDAATATGGSPAATVTEAPVPSGSGRQGKDNRGAFVKGLSAALAVLLLAVIAFALFVYPRLSSFETPKVTGESPLMARDAFVAAGTDQVRIVDTDGASVPVDADGIWRVVAQYPEPGQTAKSGADVVLTAALVAPDAVGKTLDDARPFLTARGVKSISVKSAVDSMAGPVDGDNWRVVAQDPAAGEYLSGESMTITVAPVMPAVAGKNLEEALVTLRAASLGSVDVIAGDGQEVRPGSERYWTVVTQDPMAGELATANATSVKVELVMPDLVGKTLSAADSELMSIGRFEADYANATDVEALLHSDVYVVVDQQPAGGSFLEVDTVPSLRVGVVVPNLMGMRAPEALEALEAAGLEGFAFFDPEGARVDVNGAREFVVTAQSQERGEILPLGEELRIELMCVMPNLSGSSVSEALDLLSGAGFGEVSVVDKDGDEADLDLDGTWVVLSQQPKAGELLYGSPSVDIVAGLLVPDVRGMGEGDAHELLRSLGFTNVHNIDASNGRADPFIFPLWANDWTVEDQTPAAGEAIPPDTRIDLTVRNDS